MSPARLLLAQAKTAGIRFSVTDGKLFYRAPAGAWAPGLKAAIQSRKAEIIQRLLAARALVVLRDLCGASASSWPVPDLPVRVTLLELWHEAVQHRLMLDEEVAGALAVALIRSGQVVQDYGRRVYVRLRAEDQRYRPDYALPAGLGIDLPPYRGAGAYLQQAQARLTAGDWPYLDTDDVVWLASRNRYVGRTSPRLSKQVRASADRARGSLAHAYPKGGALNG